MDKTRRLETRAAQASTKSKPRFDRRGQILPRERIARLLDAGSPFLEIGNMAGYLRDTDDPERSLPGASIIAGYGSFRGMSLIIVPTDTVGFSVSRKLDKLGLRSSDTAILTFEEMRVPKANRIGPEGQGFRLQMQQFQIERLAVALLTLSGMDEAINLTVNYCRERKVFSKPLLANQWIQFKLAELQAEIEALRHLTYFCVQKLNAGQDMTREASMAKLKAGRLCRVVADTCQQFHGGMGFVEEYPIARYVRDTRLTSIGGGADEVMMGIIAKHEGWLVGLS